MDPETVKARIRSEKMRALTNIARAPEPETAWWLSFVGEEGFRGVVIVQANDLIEAIMRTVLGNLNPGGQVGGMEIPAEIAAMIPEPWKNRLLSREDCARFDLEMKKSHPLEL